MLEGLERNNTEREPSMPDIDLAALSLEELQVLQADVAKAIDGFKERQRLDALAQVQKIAKEAGLSIEEILQVQGKTKTVSPPKYRHPENPAQTWSGRGRKPAWFVAALENGMTPDDLLIG